MRTTRQRTNRAGFVTRWRRMRADRGYIIPLMGLMIIPLIAMTAFAVDLGSWYAQGSRMQRAVDNAALAGVVWLPNKPAAEAAANAMLVQNGFGGAATFSYPAERQMRVHINRSGKQYFSRLFVQNGQNLARGATAEFNKAIPLGSPSNLFGNSPTGSPPSCSGSGAVCSGIWAAINGPYTGHNQGDPYTTKCLNTTSGGSTEVPPGSCTANPEYKPEGYMFAIDVPASQVGSTVTVQLFDAVGYDDSGANPTADSIGPNTFRTQFLFYDSDGSDLTNTISPALLMNNATCTNGGPGNMVTSSGNPGAYKNLWFTLCSFVPTKSGIHPLVVKTSNISGFSDSGSGTNQYSIRATSSGGTNPTVYSIDHMSIYSPGANAGTSGGDRVSRFYLAEIDDEYAGKQLIVDLFDPGDGTCNSPCTGFTMRFVPPPGGAPNPVPAAGTQTIGCQYNATPSVNIAPATPNTSSNCTITTKNTGSSGGVYDNRWLRVRIQLPTTYTCTTDCWWTVAYNFSTGSSTDRTVWTVQLLGDPVHLIQ